jgi:hypothetical protein
VIYSVFSLKIPYYDLYYFEKNSLAEGGGKQYLFPR